MDIRAPVACKFSKGFTLVEFLISFALVFILTLGVIPWLGDVIEKNRVLSSTNEFFSEINLSRHEAIKQRFRMVLCPSKDGRTCLASSNWHEGWILFEDRDKNNRIDSTDKLVRFTKSSPGVRITSSRFRRKIVFQPNGLSGGSNTTLTVCGGSNSEYAYAIIISNNGRPRISKTAPGGVALNCGS